MVSRSQSRFDSDFELQNQDDPNAATQTKLSKLRTQLMTLQELFLKLKGIFRHAALSILSTGHSSVTLLITSSVITHHASVISYPTYSEPGACCVQERSTGTRWRRGACGCCKPVWFVWRSAYRLWSGRRCSRSCTWRRAPRCSWAQKWIICRSPSTSPSSLHCRLQMAICSLLCGLLAAHHYE